MITSAFKGKLNYFNKNYCEMSVLFLYPSLLCICNVWVCLHVRSWWHDYGLQQQQEYFNKQLRPKLALFKTEHYSRLKTLERLHQCNICYNVWKADDVGSKQNILEQVRIMTFK